MTGGSAYEVVGAWPSLVSSGLIVFSSSAFSAAASFASLASVFLKISIPDFLIIDSSMLVISPSTVDVELRLLLFRVSMKLATVKLLSLVSEAYDELSDSSLGI